MPNGFEPNCLTQIYHKPEKKNKNLRFAICASPIIHLLFLFLLGITVVPRERKDNACAINFFFGGGGFFCANKVYCGRCANGQ